VSVWVALADASCDGLEVGEAEVVDDDGWERRGDERVFAVDYIGRDRFAQVKQQKDDVHAVALEELQFKFVARSP